MNEFLKLLNRASNVMRNSADEVMSQIGVRVGQDTILDELWHEDGLTPGKLAERLGISTPTAVRSAQRMEAAGLVIRGPDPHDGRLVRIYLTEPARAVRSAVEAKRNDLERRATATLTDTERRELIRALRKIVTEMSEYPLRSELDERSRIARKPGRRTQDRAQRMPQENHDDADERDGVRVPTVRIEILPGRTKEQKERLVKSVTEAVGSALDVDRDKVRVLFSEVKRDADAPTS